MASVRRKVKAITKQGTNHALGDLLRQLNPVLRGWKAYVRHAVAKATFGHLRHYTWNRVIRLLRQKHRKTGWNALRRRYGPTGWWPRQRVRLETAFAAHEQHVEVEVAWRCTQQVRSAYHQHRHAAGRAIAKQVLNGFTWCPIPEVARLGRTMEQWRTEFPGYFDTGGANDGRTEAVPASWRRRCRAGASHPTASVKLGRCSTSLGYGRDRGPPDERKGPLTCGGAKGTRTPNPLLAKQVRYQLRHGPLRHPTPAAPSETRRGGGIPSGGVSPWACPSPLPRAGSRPSWT